MPRNIALFELCAYVALGLGLFVFPFALGALPLLGADTSLVAIATAGGLVAFVLSGLLVWATVRRRQNWARIIYAVLVLIGLASTAFMPQGIQLLGVFSIGAFVIQTLLQLAAIYFVFTGNANAWFDRSAKPA